VEQHPSHVEDLASQGFAVFGTTSSGKSTLLNVLLGDQILPTDIDELSAGIVHLRHTQNRSSMSLVREHRSCRFELDRGQISARLTANLQAIKHGQKTSHTRSRPGRIRVWTRLENARYFFGAAASDISLIDLPGLRSEQDEINAPFIKLHARAQCPLIVLDSRRLFEFEQVQRILTFLEDNAYLESGRPLCILLNKIDAHNSGDSDIEVGFTRLREHLARHSMMRDTAPIIANVSGLVLNDAFHLKKFMTQDPFEEQHFELDVDVVERIVSDHYRFLRRQLESRFTSDSKATRRAFRSLEDVIEGHAKEVSLDAMRHVAKTLFELGGGYSLRRALTDLSGHVRSHIEQQVRCSSPSQLNKEARAHTTLMRLAYLFHRIISADEIIEKRELDVATILLEEYAQVFLQHQIAEQDAREYSAILRGTSKEVFAGSSLLGSHPAEFDWICEAMEMIAASDWDVDPREVEAISQAIRTLDR
ncbi:MAG: dynamin family protein, partial [Myxococcota bacterium]|nr:dynamin family protein [Myxococcota bacterium]